MIFMSDHHDNVPLVNPASRRTEWLITGLMTLLCLPMLQDYFSVLQLKVYYKLWPILVLVITVITIRRWRKAPEATRYPPTWIQWLILVPSLGGMLFSLLYFTPWVSTVAWIGLMAVAALQLAKYRQVENLLGLWFLLFFLLRPPYQMTLRLMAWMENLSAQTASLVMDYGSVMHAVQGNVLALPQHDFEIDILCSGWVSMISVLAMAGVFAVVRNRSCFESVFLMGLALIVTWILNIVRMLAVVSVMIWYEVDLVSEQWMPIFQLFSLFASLVLVFCADALTVFICAGMDVKRASSDTVPLRRAWLAGQWLKLCQFSFIHSFDRWALPVRKTVSPLLSGGLLVVLVGMLGIEAVSVYYRSAVTKRDFMYDEGELTKLDQSAVVLEREGWTMVSYREERRDFSSVWGMFSSIWRMKYNGTTVTLALDYPFDDWHDVKICYSNLGWKIEKETVVSEPAVFQWGVSQTDMTLPNGDYGFILCSHCDHAGNAIQPKPTDHDHTMLIYRLHPDRMTPPFGKSTNKDNRTFYQTQCMVATATPLDEASREEIRLMYASFREQIRRAVAAKAQK